ncbi:hypothetical protein [Streptomyces sp. NPDC007083]|uniref:hypothetical protein n=1 Tax=Streptomyces sp. NPDC007083 TaxID=3156913 RepID=UPI0033CEC192
MTCHVRPGINPALTARAWHSVDDLEWLDEPTHRTEDNMGKTVGIEGWTIVHQTRQKHYDDRFYGQFLGTREGRNSVAEWIVGRQYDGKSMEDGFRDGEWAYSTRFQGPWATDNADAALKKYVEMSHDTFVWDRIFEQRTGEAIDKHWAGTGSAIADVPRMSAGWQRSNPGHLAPQGSHTIYLPFYEAKYYLLHFLRSTQLSAMAHLTQGVTLDRHQAVELVTKATGSVRFEYGYNTYWFVAEAS